MCAVLIITVYCNLFLTSGQPLSIRDTARVLPFLHRLSPGIHQPPHIRVITGGLELVIMIGIFSLIYAFFCYSFRVQLYHIGPI